MLVGCTVGGAGGPEAAPMAPPLLSVLGAEGVVGDVLGGCECVAVGWGLGLCDGVGDAWGVGLGDDVGEVGTQITLSGSRHVSATAGVGPGRPYPEVRVVTAI